MHYSEILSSEQIKCIVEHDKHKIGDYLKAWVVVSVADIFNSCVLLSIYRTLIIILHNEIRARQFVH